MKEVTPYIRRGLDMLEEDIELGLAIKERYPNPPLAQQDLYAYVTHIRMATLLEDMNDLLSKIEYRLSFLAAG
jgi:hypothetical protein